MPVFSELLDQILPAIGRTARRILRRRRQGCDSYTPEIVVNLHVTTYIIVQDLDIYNDDAECVICLEEFGHGNEDSSVGIVRTNCSHVFHDRCMLRWLRQCVNCQLPYSCPLCRCIIFPTSHSHDK
ncbi:RING-H2 finger protein ATL79-like [Arachis hypogaea]|uniref:RING-H2 finger protein ATL79-like n=1 Tax=Arachis hypogaea TaxID=3818 RepID=UPI000DEC075B|nr:RING-H2 finger protein ATL79-like [Arachis hypogaea]